MVKGLWFEAREFILGRMATRRSVTALLGDRSRGNCRALNQLLLLVYAELRRIAARQLRGERADHTFKAWLNRELGSEARP